MRQSTFLFLAVAACVTLVSSDTGITKCQILDGVVNNCKTCERQCRAPYKLSSCDPHGTKVVCKCTKGC
ncbi:hypothetical protein AAVH_26873 [Aphelenchoides avenae]|nr:hypothetical protein AAVH_26872 [Aphelenchus avenae]KAH7705919.1 hypothetical protein AAVH_26873 [Aphelenchus avenae]